MVDIHSHVLWGLDDGAKDRDESIAMLKIARESKISDIVATPHSDASFSFDPNLRDERIRELGETIPRIHRGCDFHLSFENIQRALEDPAPFTINGLNFLMVEFADAFIPPTTEEVLRRFVERGIRPVVTHPERNPILQISFERLRRWVEAGCLVQVTAQSLTDRFGRNAQHSAWELLRKGLVHVIASDAHDTEHRPPRLDIACELLTREMGAETADLLLTENPSAIINGERGWLPAAGGNRKKSWFQFWR